MSPEEISNEIDELKQMNHQAENLQNSHADCDDDEDLCDHSRQALAEAYGIAKTASKALKVLEVLKGLVLFQQKTADDQQTIIDSQNEQISFLMGANSAFVQEIESLRAENKQLKDAIAQAELFVGLIESHGLEYALSKVVKA